MTKKILATGTFLAASALGTTVDFCSGYQPDERSNAYLPITYSEGSFGCKNASVPDVHYDWLSAVDYSFPVESGLEYATLDTQTVRGLEVRIDGVRINPLDLGNVANHFIISPSFFTVGRDHLAIFFYGSEGESSLLKLTYADTPEPSAFVLLLSGIIMLFVGMKRRNNAA